MGSLEERAGKEVLPDAEHLRMLLDTSASSQWMADTMHANMAEVRALPADKTISPCTSDDLVDSITADNSLISRPMPNLLDMSEAKNWVRLQLSRQSSIQ